jgi:hypothetical protein
MKKYLLVFLTVLLIGGFSNYAYSQGGCETSITDVNASSLSDLSAEYLRLASYKNPYCDTTNSDFDKIQKALSNSITTAKSSQEEVIAMMGTPYYQGPLAEYENQKVTIGRDGKPMGKSLPPSYKIPTGEYFIVYLWRKKDYLVFALKGGKVTDSTWWQKGDYR